MIPLYIAHGPAGRTASFSDGESDSVIITPLTDGASKV
jgi:hypothetical protein